MDSKGFTLIELLIVLTLVIIGGLSVSLIISGNGNFIPNKQQCINSGGKWTEGIQYGRMTKLCTYN